MGNHPEVLKNSAGLRKAPMDVQPPSTVILDLRAEEGELLAAMKNKTRYNIRLAAKKGVELSIDRQQPSEHRSVERALAEWYRLYEETARRDRITLHGEQYYRTLFTLAGNYGAGGPELYHLPSDPKQETDVFAENRDAAARLHASHVQLLEQWGTPEEHLANRRELPES